MKRWSRGAELVNLARGNSDGKESSTSKKNTFVQSFETKKIIIEKEEMAVLDEKTSQFVFQDAKPAKSDVINNDNCILDETTGELKPPSLSSESGDSECDFSVSTEDTDYKYSESSSDSTDLDTSLRTLDETSGLCSNKKAKKGQGNKNKWLRNQLKRRRQKGKQYTSIKRKRGEGIIGMEVRRQRTMKPKCNCVNSRTRKCQEILDKDRDEIFHTFWDVLSWEQRKLYVNSMVVLKPVKKQTTGIPSKRSHTLEYKLKVSGEMKAVCKKMFMNTLCIGEWSVLNWVKSAKNEICMTNKAPTVNRLKPINITKTEHIKTFLNAVPKMPSHYCRKSTCKQYVDVDYATWMELYKTFEVYMKDNNIPYEEKASYKCFLTIVHDMNLGLYRPKKDQCDLCYAFKNGNIGTEEYQTHIQAKERARQERDSDKERCLKGEVQLFTVDLQAVQNIPMISAGAQYFKLKLCVHQFTVYNEKDGSVLCYVWHEGEGGLDSNVFASCIIDFLEGLADKTKPIIIFSDGCCYQNRNVTLSNALQNFAIRHKAEIYQKYLAVGHTQMSCDSVHSTIEVKKKTKELFVPADFVRIIKEARSAKPYQVRYLSHEFFLNYEAAIKYYKSIRPGKRSGDPCVVNIRAIKYTEFGMHYKVNFDNDWKLLPQRFDSNASREVERLYNQPIPIKKRKMDDLQSLKELLPKDYHTFYDHLTHEE